MPVGVQTGDVDDVIETPSTRKPPLALAVCASPLSRNIKLFVTGTVPAP